MRQREVKPPTPEPDRPSSAASVRTKSGSASRMLFFLIVAASAIAVPASVIKSTAAAAVWQHARLFVSAENPSSINPIPFQKPQKSAVGMAFFGGRGAAEGARPGAGAGANGQMQRLLQELHTTRRTLEQELNTTRAELTAQTELVTQLSSEMGLVRGELQRLTRALVSSKKLVLSLDAGVNALQRPWLGHAGEVRCALSQRCANYINAGEDSLSATVTVAQCKASTTRVARIARIAPGPSRTPLPAAQPVALPAACPTRSAATPSACAERCRSRRP